MKISEIITDKYKLRIPPTVYYDLLADVREVEEEQEPKTGHWTYICNSSVNGLKIVECSECGTRTYGSGSFCPYCGARMVEPQGSEET